LTERIAERRWFFLFFSEGGGKPDGGETDVFPKDRLHPITHLHMDDVPVPGQVILFLFFPPKRIASAKL
jgi:hypothetical protein